MVFCICNNEFGEIEDNICNIGKVRDRDGGGAAVKNGNVGNTNIEHLRCPISSMI